MNNLLKKTAMVSMMCAAVISVSACNGKKLDSTSAAKTENILNDQSSFDQKAAYAIGASLGTYVAQMKAHQEQLVGELPVKYISSGFLDGLNNVSEMQREEIEAVLKDLDNQVQEKIEAQSKIQSEANLKAGELFLEQKAKEDGVMKTDSGLLYKVITEGKGDKAVKGDTVSVIYKGTTIDGTVFDEQKNAVDFQLDSLIPGWVEGLQMMNPGSEYEFYIPADLAYGENGVGQVIMPNSALVFSVKLVSVKKAEEKK